MAEMARMTRNYPEEKKVHSRRSNTGWDKLTKGQYGWNAASKEQVQQTRLERWKGHSM